jgi:hypothetical protein
MRATGMTVVAAIVGSTTLAAADFVEWQFESYPIVVGGEAFAVIDAYAAFDDADDTVLNVFNAMITTSSGLAFHHSDVNTLAGDPGAWNATGTADLPDSGIESANDSFVKVGGEIGGTNTTALDPSFDPVVGGTISENAGWYNSFPPNLQGRVEDGDLRTHLARFVLPIDNGDTVLNFAANVGYNQGLGTGAQFAYDALESGPTVEVEFFGICNAPVLDASSATFAAAGGSGSFGVLPDTACVWEATTTTAWITLTGETSGTGDGTVEFDVAPQAAAVERIGEILVDGSVFTVTQTAAACTVSIDDPDAAFPVGGGTGSFGVSTNGPTCSWNAFSSAGWVTITEGASGVGTSGTIAYSVLENPNAFERTAVIVVGTVTHQITQAPAPCAVTGLGDDGESYGPAGGSGIFTVSTNGGTCSWTATSSASWVTISSGGSGTGSSGAIAYSVSANPVAADRSAEIVVGPFTYSITQAAAPCSVLSISAGSSEIGFDGGPGSFEVTTNGGSCEWSATSSADWIVLDSGSGSGVVSTLSFTAAANELAEGRSGEISVGGFVHTVVQEPAPCVVTAAIPSEVAAVPGEASYSVAITTNGDACAWSATTADEWITLDVASGVGNAGIEFTVAANPITAERVGSIAIGDVMVMVTQAALPCAIVSVDPAEAGFDFLGGPLTVSVETNGENCTWEATSDVAWITIVEGGTGTGTTGTIAVEVAIHDGVESRFGTLTVGSQSVAVAQSGGPDCNANGLGDDYEIFEGLVPDCNGNDVPDSCDVADGTSEDLNGNGIPDECEQDLVVSVPGDYPTIQDAIDGSLDGWTIQVAPGVYNERLALGNRQIVVEAMTGLGETVIDGDGLPGSVVTMIAPVGNTDPGPTLRGFTITGGTIGTPVSTNPSIFGGGGIYAEESRGRVEGCRLEGNSATFGGGAYLRYCQMEFVDCVVRSNLANADGGGLQFFRGGNTAVSCVIEANDAIGQGGGLHNARSNSSLVDCQIRTNLADLGGGVSAFIDVGEVLTIVGCEISLNFAEAIGGGLWVRPGFDTVLIENSVICDNAPDEIFGDFTDLGGNTLCLCPADLTGNGVVNGADLAELLAVWGPCNGGACAAADFNDDGVVNGADLTVMLGNWGPCP